MEQTRKKYQSELATITNELEVERDNVIHARGENGRLRDELEELRNKWDDEVLNSSTWAKEKSRLEVALQSLSDSRDEAVNSQNEAQGKIVELLGQVRHLRSNVDDVAAERDMLITEKKGLETRLAEAAASLEDLSRSGSPTKRDAALSDREVLDLKSKLAHQEDVASAAVGKMRRSDLLAQEVQKDIATEREKSVQLHKEKAALEKSVKDLQLKCIDLETKGYSSGSQDVRFLHGRVQEVSFNDSSIGKVCMLTSFHSSSNNLKNWRRAAAPKHAACATSTAQSRTCSRKSSAATSPSLSCPTTSPSPATRSSAFSPPLTSCKPRTPPRSSRPSVPNVNSAKSARRVCAWSASSRATVACASSAVASLAASASPPLATTAAAEAAGGPAQCGRRAWRVT